MINKSEVLFTFAKSYHISHNQDYFCCVGSKVNLYNISGELIFEFKDIKSPNCSQFTSDQSLIVKTSEGRYYIFDLVSLKLIKQIPPPKNVLGSTTIFQITSDNKYGIPD